MKYYMSMNVSNLNYTWNDFHFSVSWKKFEWIQMELRILPTHQQTRAAHRHFGFWLLHSAHKPNITLDFRPHQWPPTIKQRVRDPTVNHTAGKTFPIPHQSPLSFVSIRSDSGKAYPEDVLADVELMLIHFTWTPSLCLRTFPAVRFARRWNPPVVNLFIVRILRRENTVMGHEQARKLAAEQARVSENVVRATRRITNSAAST